MNAQKMIKEYKIGLIDNNGQPALSVPKQYQANIAEIKANRNEIIAKLQAQKELRIAENAARENARKLQIIEDKKTAIKIVTYQGGHEPEIMWARKMRDAEKIEYKEWIREIGYIVVERIAEVDYSAILSVIKKREKPDGCLLANADTAIWTITDDEEKIIVVKNNEIQIAKKARIEKNEKDAIEYNKAMKDSGICPKCGTWCYGDCEI